MKLGSSLSRLVNEISSCPVDCFSKIFSLTKFICDFVFKKYNLCKFHSFSSSSIPSIEESLAPWSLIAFVKLSSFGFTIELAKQIKTVI